MPIDFNAEFDAILKAEADAGRPVDKLAEGRLRSAHLRFVTAFLITKEIAEIRQNNDITTDTILAVFDRLSKH